MTPTQRILERDNYRCAYCGGRATTRDHLVCKALRRRHKGFDGDEWIVAACFNCNIRRSTFRLVPASWADRISELPGVKPWRVWDGGKLP